jgi:two-component system response regulator (stage 0 sporulation protein F)
MIYTRERNLPAVLVVDDEPDVRTLLKAVLELDGHEVLMAADGRDACAVLDSTPSIGLVVLDLVMPNQEGIETISEISRQHPLVKIVAISGAFGGQCLEIARHLGADATIPKPLDLGRLRDSVMSLLKT